MPAQRLRPNDLQRFQHPGSQPIEAHKQQPVDAAESHSLRSFAPQDIELMAKHKDFGFQRSPDRNSPIKAHQINLQRSLIEGTIDRFAGVSQLFWVCGRASYEPAILPEFPTTQLAISSLGCTLTSLQLPP